MIRGVRAIKIAELEVDKIFLDVFMGLTKTMAKIELKSCDLPVIEDEYINIIVHITGAFSGIIVCTLEKELRNAICDKMAYGVEGIPRELLIQEYMNVICGNSISMINTKLKKTSRLSVPKVTSEEDVRGEIEKPYDKKVNISFLAEYGKLAVDIYYMMDSGVSKTPTKDTIRKE